MAKIKINAQVTDNIGFIDYYFKRPFIKRLYIKNYDEEPTGEVIVNVSSEPNFSVGYTTVIQNLPPKTTVNISPEEICLSPVFLANLENSVDSKINITVVKDNKKLASLTAPVNVLGFEQFKGTNVNIEEIVPYIKSNGKQIATIIDKSNMIIKNWSLKAKTFGYENSTKNSVRNHIASIFTAIQSLNIVKNFDANIENICSTSSAKKIVETKTATNFEMALFFAGALEKAGYNVVFSKVENSILVGAFLADKNFPENVIYEKIDLEKRFNGISQISMVDVNYLFGQNNLNFQSAENFTKNKIAETEKFDFAIDVARSRGNNLKPLPIRVKSAGGFNLVEAKDFNKNVAPKKLAEFDKKLELEGINNRQQQWMRRLLDLSLKNSLLNFKANVNSVHIMSNDMNFTDYFNKAEEFELVEVAKDLNENYKNYEKFGNNLKLKPVSDLLNIEIKKHRLRTYLENKKLDSTLKRIIRKDKTTIEESGASTLYLACGFLHIIDNMSNHYAPLLLYPVKVYKNQIKNKYILEFLDDEIHFNSTLLEYLKQEYALDLRGLNNLKTQEVSAYQILERVKTEIVEKKGWEVTEDIYLSSFSFARYMMWYDIENNFDAMRENKIISSLLDNKYSIDKRELKAKDVSSDEVFSNERIYIPISCDGSQYSAVVDATEKSFVLHGPPGTGKSQTITNIIANSIARGNRVLFVAEKMAALEVVKKRLDDIGVGDFCLELHSKSANKVDVANKLLKTVQLESQTKDPNYIIKAKEIMQIVNELNGEIEALHKPKKLDISIYDGILQYLENENASDELSIENTFFERLTGSDLVKYEKIISDLSSSAKECGEVNNSPFENVGGFKYSLEWKRRGETACDLYIIEMAHLAQYANILLELLDTRARKLTRKRLNDLNDIAKYLLNDDINIRQIFIDSTKLENLGVLSAFQSTYEKFLAIENAYFEDFKSLPKDINYAQLKKDLSKNGWFLNSLNSTFKKLQKVSKGNLDKNNRDYYLKKLHTYHEYIILLDEKIVEVKNVFTTLDKDIKLVDLVNIVKQLNEFYKKAENLYTDFNKNTFNNIINKIVKNPSFILTGYIYSYELFEKTEKEFVDAFNYQLDFYEVDEDHIENMTLRVGLIVSNLDIIHNWCKFNELIEVCKNEGIAFCYEPLLSGELNSTNLLSSFKKKVYHNFIETEIALDSRLAEFSQFSLEDKIEKLRLLNEEYEELTRKEIRYRLLANLPKAGEDGEHNLELVTLQRAVKSNMKSITLRKLYTEIPTLFKAACPCLLMSPISVAEYLETNCEKFDLVIFDEASQMPTCEAVGAISRGHKAIIVGDPHQLPPTKFFSAGYVDEENLDSEDLESILDDCLALGMPERHLLWHYRSRHESLIAFSNAMYYENKLLTFPSPEELQSNVKFNYVQGSYDRGLTKTNKKEAEALVAEIISRLKNPKLRDLSIGVVTFSSAQQNLIEDMLASEVAKNKMESYAFNKPEPIFVKNLENVQGDERDIILFSVGYGPDKYGRLYLNFGPINQAGGERRLNVAVSRARVEMVVFSSMTGAMIDLNKTESKGVIGLKAFLEYAEFGKEMLSINAKNIQAKTIGIGDYVSKELKKAGFRCQTNIGVSDFKIDVAVIDRTNRNRYLLAILLDGKNCTVTKSAKDRNISQTKVLKQLGWNIYKMYTVSFLSNPKREIKKVVEFIKKLENPNSVAMRSAEKNNINKYLKEYKTAYTPQLKASNNDYLFKLGNEDAIIAKIEKILEAEMPIEKKYLIKKLAKIYNLKLNSKKAVNRLEEILSFFNNKLDKFGDLEFFVNPSEKNKYEYFRIKNDKEGKRKVLDIYPNEIITAYICLLQSCVSMKREQLITKTLKLLGFTRVNEESKAYLESVLNNAIEKGILLVNVNGDVTV